MTVYLGIDPGKTGALAWMDSLRRLTLIRMPSGYADLCDELSRFDATDTYCVIEKVWGRPGEGARGAFSFGQGYGWLQVALYMHGIPAEPVTPATWQRTLGSLTKGDKAVSLQRARSLFPGVKIHKYAADAALLCEYARRLYGAREVERATSTEC